jgi:hypothetical protein
VVRARGREYVSRVGVAGFRQVVVGRRSIEGDDGSYLVIGSWWISKPGGGSWVNPVCWTLKELFLA